MLPETVQRDVTARWGEAETDPFVRGAAFHLPLVMFGNVAVMLQPARGYDRDETAAYHDPDLVPPHAYIATYLWLRHVFGAHAVIHNGKHGSPSTLIYRSPWSRNTRNRTAAPGPPFTPAP